MQLDLVGGYHAGPLFVTVKRRAPLISSGLMAGKRRRAREKRATPPWADLTAIRAVYRQAEEMTKATGELHVVDHIVPLAGKLVCGLHVHWNMQVSHWKPNAVKGWGVWPDMPFEQLELL